MEEPDRHGTNRDADGRPKDPDGRADDQPENNATAEDPTEEVSAEGVLAKDAGRNRAAAKTGDTGEFRRRLGAKDRHIRELYEELAATRLAADEARARAEASGSRVRDLEEERARLKERLRVFEEEERRRRRRREGQDRRVARLGREIERREADIARLEDLLAQREDEISRKDAALEDALRRVEGLERDLEEREGEAVELRSTVAEIQADLDLEYELRRRMAEPANRLRAGIDLFNDSKHLKEIGSISKSLGQPEVHVVLGEGDDPPVILTFTWRDVTWRTYSANPGLAVEEPRVYLESTGEDLSGVEREPSNAHVGPGGRVVLGL